MIKPLLGLFFGGVVIALAVLAWLAMQAEQEPGGTSEKSVVQLDPALDTIVDLEAKLELLSDDFPHTSRPSTEGPVWIDSSEEPDGGYFLFTDSRRSRLAKWSTRAGLTGAYDLQEMLGELDPARSSSSGLAIDPQRRVVFCSSGRHAVVRIEKNGTPTILAESYDGKRLDNPNDLTISADGSIYFTDNAREETRLMPPTVYLLKDGDLTPLITDLTSPNGITLSPDGTVLYVNDIRPRKLYRYEVQPDGSVANGRLFVDMSGREDPGANDGMRTDRNGNLYSSGPGGVWIISPNGKHLGTILAPDRITNLTFGGADGKTLFMTAHGSIFRIQLKASGRRQ